MLYGMPLFLPCCHSFPFMGAFSQNAKKTLPRCENGNGQILRGFTSARRGRGKDMYCIYCNNGGNSISTAIYLIE